MPLAAFPGAEGFGSTTIGGRGGTVLYVTNLNESGAGSLRAAVEAAGPRYVVFQVSGTITHAQKPLKIKNPFITIAGETSPGGIQLAGEEVSIQTHDVIMRYLRIRTGDVDVPQDGYDNRDALNTGLPSDQFATWPYSTYNNIVDHCSLSWSTDEVHTMWFNTHNMTTSNCIIAEGLFRSKHPKGPHSMGFLSGVAAHNLSWHHNLVANCNQRMPQIAGVIQSVFDANEGGAHPVIGHDFRNNVVFNWGQAPCEIEGLNNKVNFVGNYYKLGPDFNRANKQCIRIEGTALQPVGFAQIYITGNVDPTSPNPAIDNWQMIRKDSGGTIPEAGIRLADPLATPAVTTYDALFNFDYVIQNAGCTVPFRDPVDLRTLSQVRKTCFKTGTTYFVDSVAQAGGWPDMDTDAEVPLDTNLDGVPDYFAIESGFSINDDIANVEAPSGYTWIEEWFHSLAV